MSIVCSAFLLDSDVPLSSRSRDRSFVRLFFCSCSAQVLVRFLFVLGSFLSVPRLVRTRVDRKPRPGFFCLPSSRQLRLMHVLVCWCVCVCRSIQSTSSRPRTLLTTPSHSIPLNLSPPLPGSLPQGPSRLLCCSLPRSQSCPGKQALSGRHPPVPMQTLAASLASRAILAMSWPRFPAAFPSLLIAPPPSDPLSFQEDGPGVFCRGWMAWNCRLFRHSRQPTAPCNTCRTSQGRFRRTSTGPWTEKTDGPRGNFLGVRTSYGKCASGYGGVETERELRWCVRRGGAMAAPNPESAAALANLLTKVARYAVVLGAAGSVAQASMYNGAWERRPRMRKESKSCTW